MGESLKADGKIPWALNLARAATGAFSILYGYFLANELEATPLSISCVLKGRFVVISRLSYDACSAEKSKDLICPPKSIPFDSIGFYNTFCFSSLRSRDFVPEEMADILGNHCTGRSGCSGGNG